MVYLYEQQEGISCALDRNSGHARLGDWKSRDRDSAHRASICVRRISHVALEQDGILWAWGNNNDGELGDGTGISSLVPVRVGTDTSWRTVTAGYFHTAAIRADGTMWAWGNNDLGQLGDGTSGGWRNSPVQVEGADWQ